MLFTVLLEEFVIKWLKKPLSFSFQKAFVTERADLIESNRKKWETAMLQRRDKEVVAALKWSMLFLNCEICRKDKINIGSVIVEFAIPNRLNTWNLVGREWKTMKISYKH